MLHPTDALGCTTAPTNALCLSLASAVASSEVALHFLPVRTSKPAAESLYCSAYLVWETLNSSTMLLNGSCRMFCLPYRAALLRLGGRPSHLQRYPLIFLSIASTDVTGTSYTCRGQRMQCRMPCY